MRFYKMFGMSAMLFAAILMVSGCAGDKPAAEKRSNETETATTADPTHGGWSVSYTHLTLPTNREV